MPNETLWYPRRAPGCFHGDQMPPHVHWWNRTTALKPSSTNIVKAARGKDIGPTCGFAASPEVGSGVTVGTLQTGYLYAQDLTQVPQRQTSHLAQEGFGVATCPVTPGPPLGEGGLQCRHESHGSRPASRCGRALASWRVPWHWASFSTGEGFGVVTCPAVPDLPPGAGGL
jgi:hypothetical protein